MKIFIFQSVDQCSYNYHSGGGVVIIANNIEEAKKMADEKEYIELTDDDWNKAESFDLLKNEKPNIWIMPDAGCC